MKERCLGAPLVLGLAIAMAVAIVPAQAKPGYSVWAGYRESQFSVKGTHGYEITVSHTGRRVELTAYKGRTTAIYIVRAEKPSGDGTIEAAFPGVGRVSVRFHPSGRPQRRPPFYPPECSGGGEVRQRGTFSGTIRFEGEQDFTRVAVGNARGFTHLSIKEVCKGGSSDNGSRGFLGYSMTSFARSHDRLVAFQATRDTSEDVINGDTTYWGQTVERHEGMLILRIAFARANPNTFVVGGPSARPNTASIAPPAPFRGDATFSATVAGRAMWEGTLAIDLPGARGVKLAGPSFSSRLCLSRHCRGDLPSIQANGRIR